MTIQEFLESKGASEEYTIWAKGKSWPEIYATCERGDFLNWLYFRSPGYDLRKATLVKALQAKQVERQMPEESKKALAVALAFGQGKASREELDAAASVAMATAWAASAAASRFTWSAGAAARATRITDVDAAAWVAFAASKSADAATEIAAWNKSLKRSADIFRKYISLEDFKFEFE